MFRRDLYDRIAEVTIHVPPLRERTGDVDLLLEHFLSEHRKGSPARFARESLTILRSYLFPGNVRELENIVSHASIACDGDTILPQHLPLRSMGAFLPSEAPAPLGTTATPAGKPSDLPKPEFAQELALLLPDNWLEIPYREASSFAPRHLPACIFSGCLSAQDLTLPRLPKRLEWTGRRSASDGKSMDFRL